MIAQVSIPTCVDIASSGGNRSALRGLHLGKHRDTFFAVEFTNISRRGHLNDELCGCDNRCDVGLVWPRRNTREAFDLYKEGPEWLRQHPPTFVPLLTAEGSAFLDPTTKCPSNCGMKPAPNRYQTKALTSREVRTVVVLQRPAQT